jgi:hypothetical protein
MGGARRDIPILGRHAGAVQHFAGRVFGRGGVAMTYPRRCPLCGADCGGPARRVAGGNVVSELRHVTTSAGPGGTPSPWLPELPGRLLALRCLACDGEYGWDYFAGRPSAVPTSAPRRPKRAPPPRRRSVASPSSRRPP